jgi:hypothetical protein
VSDEGAPALAQCSAPGSAVVSGEQLRNFPTFLKLKLVISVLVHYNIIFVTNFNNDSGKFDISSRMFLPFSEFSFTFPQPFLGFSKIRVGHVH